MSYGLTADGKKHGFADVEDWLDSVIESFPSPWSIAIDTHYGTVIKDSHGRNVMSFWMAYGNPSDRERGNQTIEEWHAEQCDTHWESETQWHLVNAAVACRNSMGARYSDDLEQLKPLRCLIVGFASWKDDVRDDLLCGGPNRRTFLE